MTFEIFRGGSIMSDFKNKIAEILNEKIEELSLEEILDLIERPKHTDMGDYSFPCFKLAKVFRKAPNMIAADIAEKVAGDQLFDKVEAVAAYVNFTLSKGNFAGTVVGNVLAQGEQYGATGLGEGKNVIVEFSSVNIAKEFHMGHIRSTMIGNSLYRIYKFLGYNTTAVNHLGDYGTQFGKMIVAFKMWGDRAVVEQNPVGELVKLYVRFHEEAEKEPSLDDTAREWFTKLENKDEEAVELWQWMRDLSLVEFKRVYKLLGCHFDSFAGESFYSDKMPAVLDELRAKDVLTKSEGAEIVDLEAHGMPPALITKKDGSTLYMTRDLAAAFYRKKTYEFDKNIYVVGSQQNLHFQQWFKIIEMMGHEWAKDLVHVGFGMVGLEEGSMSTRKGRVVRLEDVLLTSIDKIKETIEEKNPSLENKEDVARQVGVGAVVFQELFHNRIKDYTFSWTKMLSFEGESGPYVQYTHARACSVLRKANIELENVDYSLLNDEASIDVVRLLNQFPNVVEDAAEKNEPSLVTRYVVDVAKSFNKFYHDNQINVEDIEVKKARVALVQATKTVIKNGLYLVSIEAPERM